MHCGVRSVRDVHRCVTNWDLPQPEKGFVLTPTHSGLKSILKENKPKQLAHKKAYLDVEKYILKSIFIVPHIYVNQLFSADATMYRKYIFLIIFWP